MGSDKEESTRRALDVAVRAHAESEMGDGEVVVSWLVLAATRRFDGGGAVIHMPHHEAMPFWEARGLLGEALAAVDRLAAQEGDDPDEP